MSGGPFTEVVGYGVRAPRDEPSVLASAPLALRVRPWLVASQAASGVASLAVAGVAGRALTRAGDGSPLEVTWLLLFGSGMLVLGIESLAAALTWAVAPLVRTEAGRVRWRRPFPARVVAFDADELVWRHDARFVGRYLLTTRLGRARRIPIWLLSRAAQRALFAWLDANVPPSRGRTPPDRGVIPRGRPRSRS